MPQFTNVLFAELLATAGYNSNLAVNVGVIGDSFNDTPQQTFASPTIPAFVRKPAGSSSTIASGAWTPDVPGRYVVSVSAGGASETRTRDIYPASVLTTKVAPGNPNSRLVSRTHLQGASNDPRCSQTTVTASLEASPSTVIGLLGGLSGPAWTQFGEG